MAQFNLSIAFCLHEDNTAWLSEVPAVIAPVVAVVGGTVFFFQAEDGIRDADVTGVQTCALPISSPTRTSRAGCAGTRVGGAGWQVEVRVGDGHAPVDRAPRVRQLGGYVVGRGGEHGLLPRHRRRVVDDPEKIDLRGAALPSAGPHDAKHRAQNEEIPPELAHLLSPLFDARMGEAIPKAYEQAGCHGIVVRYAEAACRRTARSGAASRGSPRRDRKRVV